MGVPRKYGLHDIEIISDRFMLGEMRLVLSWFNDPHWADTDHREAGVDVVGCGLLMHDGELLDRCVPTPPTRWPHRLGSGCGVTCTMPAPRPCRRGACGP